MTPDRFTQLLDAYGGDPKRWPEAERAEALALADRDAASRAALDAARGLDALIGAMKVSAPSVDVAKIVAAAALVPQERASNVIPFAGRRFAARPAMAWARMGALAAAAVCGFIIGMSDPATDNSANALDLFDAVQTEDSAW